MKKLSLIALVSALALPVFADDLEEDVTLADSQTPVLTEKRLAPWPAYIAIGEIPETPDLIGLRVTIPYSTRQESVTGIDIGFWGRCLYFEGFQVNVLRNDAKNACGGLQCGIYNTVGCGDMLGVQFGLFNEAITFRGAQAGLINLAGSGQGVQIGIINRADELYGFQFGLINVIRNAELAVLPIVNIGF